MISRCRDIAISRDMKKARDRDTTRHTTRHPPSRIDDPRWRTLTLDAAASAILSIGGILLRLTIGDTTCAAAINVAIRS